MSAEFPDDPDVLAIVRDVRVAVTVELPSGASLSVTVAYPEPATWPTSGHVATVALDDATRGVRAVLGEGGAR